MSGYDNEPVNLRAWTLPNEGGRFYTCGRPGRSLGLEVKEIPDIVVAAWAQALAPRIDTIIFSALEKASRSKRV